jgi:sec-independent protein translocase protein TatA
MGMPVSFFLVLGAYLKTFLNFASIRKRKSMTLSILLIFGLGTTELLLIGLVVLLLFGGKKIPELMKGLGKGVKSFKDGMKDMEDEINSPTPKKEEPREKPKE